MKYKFLFALLFPLLSATILEAQVRKDQNLKVAPNKNLKVKSNPALQNLAVQKIQLEDINEWLCPRALLRGDREFDGHGPKIKCEVTLRPGNDGSSLWADIYFWAQETVHDWSTTEGRWSKKVYDAPYGQKITKIKSATASRTQFISPAAGFQFLFPGDDVKTAMSKFFDGAKIMDAVLALHGMPNPAAVTQQDIARLVSTYKTGNTVVKVPATDGELVKFFHIVGDTGGPDISSDNNCNDDTRIVKIEFFPVQVEMVKTGN